MNIFGSVMAAIAGDGTVKQVTCKCGNVVYYRKEEGKWKIYSDKECTIPHDCGKERK